MKLARLHRRLTVLLALSALLALVGGAGFTPTAPGAFVALGVALFWQPRARAGRILDRVWLVIALVLVVRAALVMASASSLEVEPWLDLLLVLLSAESLRPLQASNDARLYGLSFALLIAATAYRPGVVFLVAFVGFVIFAMLALMVGYVRRQGERNAAADLSLGRPVLLAMALLSIVTLTTAGGVFLLFPRVAGGWMARTTGTGRTVAGFGNDISIAEHGSEIQENPEVALRIEFRGAPPLDVAALHWRGKSFDYFDGRRWYSSRNLPSGALRISANINRWPGPAVRYEVFSADLAQHVIFGLHPLISIEPRTPMRPVMNAAGDLTYIGEGAPIYGAVSKHRPPDGDLLRAVSGPDPSALRRRSFSAFGFYLQLPALSPEIRALADSLTRGYDNDYDKAVAVQRYLRGEFRYTRELPSSALDATLDAFLFQRRAGHCEYFSTAMVVLLRAAGVPARNVTGFLGGDWNEFGNYLLVTQDRAHSWVEVWFPGVGWVEFDPTPTVAATVLANDSRFASVRMLFDGLQHRWEKWVLDYNLQRQVELATGLARMFSTNRGTDAERDFHLPWRRILLLTAAALALLWILRRGGTAGERSPAAREASRIYLSMRRAYARAGMLPREDVGPLELCEHIAASEAPARAPAHRIVELYVASRFGRRPFTPAMREEMRQALLQVRRRLGAGRATT